MLYIFATDEENCTEKYIAIFEYLTNVLTKFQTAKIN